MKTMTKALLLLASLSFSTAVSSHALAQGFGFRALECAATLRSAQAGSVVSDNLTKASHDAFGEFHNFNAMVSQNVEDDKLAGLDPFANVFATSASNDLTPIIARLAGLEAQQKAEPTAENPQVQSYGSVGSGEAALDYFREEELVRKTFGLSTTRRFLLRRTEAFFSTFRNGAALSAGLFITHYTPTLGPLVVGLGALVTLDVLRTLFSTLHTLTTRLDWRAPAIIETTTNLAKNGQNGDWFYRGETYYVDQAFIDWIASKHIEGDEALIANYIKSIPDALAASPYDRTAVDIVVKDAKMLDEGLVSPRMLKHSTPEKQYRAVYIDQLLRMREADDGTVQPEFSVFVRVAKKRSKLQLVQTKRVGLRALIPVRVTNPAK